MVAPHKHFCVEYCLTIYTTVRQMIYNTKNLYQSKHIHILTTEFTCLLNIQTMLAKYNYVLTQIFVYCTIITHQDVTYKQLI